MRVSQADAIDSAVYNTQVEGRQRVAEVLHAIHKKRVIEFVHIVLIENEIDRGARPPRPRAPELPGAASTSGRQPESPAAATATERTMRPELALQVCSNAALALRVLKNRLQELFQPVGSAQQVRPAHEPAASAPTARQISGTGIVFGDSWTWCSTSCGTREVPENVMKSSRNM